MKTARNQLRLTAALAAILVLGAACAENGGSDAAATNAPTGPTASGATAGAGPTAATGSTYGGGGAGGGRYDYGSGGGGQNGSGNAGGGEDVTVRAADFAFSPTAIEVAAGSEISIENTDGVTHTFTVAGTDVDLELEPGEIEDATIDLAPGAYDFHCKIHASMTGTLTVT